MRNKVEEIVEKESANKSVKDIINLDKNRLGYQSDEESNQWPRNCQNSGDDKKRRPDIIQDVEDLQKLGYVLKDKIDIDGKLENFEHYERKVYIDNKGNVTTKGKGQLVMQNHQKEDE